MSPETLIMAEGVSTAYRQKGRRGWQRRGRGVVALRDVSLSVASGEVLGVIGPNGAGKSTLLLTLAGVVSPSAGAISVARPIGPFLQVSPGFHRELSGRENAIITSMLLGATRAEAIARFEEIAEFTELSPETLDSQLLTYSAGMILRLGFAVVLLSEPRVLLIDEVMAVADEGFRLKCVARVNELVSHGAAMIVVSHDLSFIEEIAQRVCVLVKGGIRLIGLPREAAELYHEVAGV